MGNHDSEQNGGIEEETPEVDGEEHDKSSLVPAEGEIPALWARGIHVQMDQEGCQWAFLNQLFDRYPGPVTSAPWQAVARVGLPIGVAFQAVVRVIEQFVWMVNKGHTWPPVIMKWLREHRFLTEDQGDQ